MFRLFCRCLWGSEGTYSFVMSGGKEKQVKNQTSRIFRPTLEKKSKKHDVMLCYFLPQQLEKTSPTMKQSFLDKLDVLKEDVQEI